MALLITKKCINCDMCEPDEEQLWDKFVLLHHADKL
ncbi:MAG: hypothetical protein E7I50_16130 [Klebsiella oxytoca]|nr:hypothetical protein [Klebsiella oxytoca]